VDTGYKPQINRIAAFAIAFSLMEGEESLLHNLIIRWDCTAPKSWESYSDRL